MKRLTKQYSSSLWQRQTDTSKGIWHAKSREKELQKAPSVTGIAHKVITYFFTSLSGQEHSFGFTEKIHLKA